MATPNDIADEMKKISEKVQNTLRRKGSDYSGNTDTFSSFKTTSSLSNVPTEKVIFTRIADKMSRIGNILDTENKVKDETVEDTIVDCIGYLVLLKSYLHEKNNTLVKKVVVEEDDGLPV